MKKILFPLSLITLLAINNESFASKTEPIEIDLKKESKEIVLRIQTYGTETVTPSTKIENTEQLRTIAQCGFINTGMKVLVKTLYPLQGLSQVIAWTGATVATVTTTMRDYFPLLDEYIVPTQKISIVVGVFGGLAYAGCNYAVHALEKSLINFDNTRKSLATTETGDKNTTRSENDIEIEMQSIGDETQKNQD